MARCVIMFGLGFAEIVLLVLPLLTKGIGLLSVAQTTCKLSSLFAAGPISQIRRDA